MSGHVTENHVAKSPITIVVDAMGGDHAPEEVVKAAAALSVEKADGSEPLHLLLVGDAPRLHQLLMHQRYDAECLAIHHASQVITMEESPREALAAKQDSSIAVAARLCSEGRASALVSAGNTGAAVLSCLQYWKRLPGIRR